ncbi:hypothetical protein J5N97_012587 [Dioscorea zingiberensis]|uniref:CRM domain-containing protein n=1 Tax=Dioscorea zingiberensis TaxID=325984 RepID=A0A9D5CP75_9LILI|nr:hypothetical protein J5N97_012587 [Dioscorea zingiberensis]
MAARFLLLQRLKRLQLSPLLHSALIPNQAITTRNPALSSTPCHFSKFSIPPSPFRNSLPFRSFSHGTVNLVLSEGKPKFEVIEPELPMKEKWRTKKQLKLQRKRDKKKRRSANRTDPRRIRPKGLKKKQRFPTAEARIKYKIEKAKLKEALLVEKLKKYEVPKVQCPIPKPEVLTGEERFYMKKMAQKRSNYAVIGRRGVFGGVILNMHLHWKKHETVKVVCKPCKPGQVHEYASEIARLSGGTPIQVIGEDTIVFYRGKNYVQPEVMSPINTLSKKKALEKSKYEQSLETVRRFIAIAEKELELYYRHVALYGDPNTRNSDLIYTDQTRGLFNRETDTSDRVETECNHSISDDLITDVSDSEVNSDDQVTEAVDNSTSDDINTDISDLEAESDYEATKAEGISGRWKWIHQVQWMSQQGNNRICSHPIHQ